MKNSWVSFFTLVILSFGTAWGSDRTYDCGSLKGAGGARLGVGYRVTVADSLAGIDDVVLEKSIVVPNAVPSRVSMQRMADENGSLRFASPSYFVYLHLDSLDQLTDQVELVSRTFPDERADCLPESATPSH